MLLFILRKLFWTDIGAQPVVESASLEGKTRAIIASTNLVSPSGLTIDFTEDRLFWCDLRRGVVETAGLDGSHRQVLLDTQVGEARLVRTEKTKLFAALLLNFERNPQCMMIRQTWNNILKCSEI